MKIFKFSVLNEVGEEQRAWELKVDENASLEEMLEVMMKYVKLNYNLK